MRIHGVVGLSSGSSISASPIVEWTFQRLPWDTLPSAEPQGRKALIEPEARLPRASTLSADFMLHKVSGAPSHDQ